MVKPLISIIDKIFLVGLCGQLCFKVTMALNLKMSSQRNVLALGSTLGGKRLVAAPLTRKYYRKLGLGTRSFRGDSADEEELLPFVCSAERSVIFGSISSSNCMYRVF